MSGRFPIWLRRVALAIAACALAMLSISCSRAVKMSVLEPADLVALPAGGGDSHSQRVMRRDSVVTLDDGLLVVRGDSLLAYMRAEPVGSSLHVPQPGIYQYQRSAHRLRIAGFLPSGIHWREWEGDLIASADSLEFVRRAVPSRGLRRGFPAETLLAPPRACERVDLEQTDVVHTVVVVTLVTAVLAGVAFAGMMASSSGPFAP
jgi:hypothetical protein